MDDAAVVAGLVSPNAVVLLDHLELQLRSAQKQLTGDGEPENSSSTTTTSTRRSTEA